MIMRFVYWLFGARGVLVAGLPRDLWRLTVRHFLTWIRHVEPAVVSGPSEGFSREVRRAYGRRRVRRKPAGFGHWQKTGELLPIGGGATPAIPAVGAAGPGYWEDAIETILGRVRDRVVDVRDHEAVGDGVTDDTAAIQAAIDLAWTAFRGGTVWFPPGTYVVSSTLNVAGSSGSRAGIYLVGAGNPHPVLSLPATAGTTIRFTGTGYAVNFFNCRHCGISNMRIAGADLTDGAITSGRNGIYVHSNNPGSFNTRFITVERVVIESMDIAIKHGNTSGGDGTGTQWQSDQCFYRAIYIHNSNTGLLLDSQNNDASRFEDMQIISNNFCIDVRSSGFQLFRNHLYILGTPDGAVTDSGTCVYFRSNRYGHMTFEKIQTEVSSPRRIVKFAQGGSASALRFLDCEWGAPFDIDAAGGTLTGPIAFEGGQLSGTMTALATDVNLMFRDLQFLNFTLSLPATSGLAQIQHCRFSGTNNFTAAGTNSAIVRVDHNEKIVAWDPGSIADGAVAFNAVSMPVAQLGDYVVVTHESLGANSVMLTGHVSANGTVRVVMFNKTGGNFDLPTGNLKIRIIKKMP